MKHLVVLALVALTAAGCGKKEVKDDPQPAEPVVQEEEVAMVEVPVSFESGGMTVYGTVTRPSEAGKYPAIAIAAGSGPTDRDWLNPLLPGANGSAKLLAEALAERGVVVLRYDKRGTGKTGMPPGAINWGEYADELSAATQTLAQQDFVDPAAIYVAGHSEGGAHALRVAANPPVPLAGVLLLSAAGRTLRDIVLWQISGQIRSSGLNPAAQDAEIAALTKALDAVAGGQTVDPRTVGQLPGVQQFIASLQNPMSVNFARGLLVYDPTQAFSKFESRVLVLNGNRDIQVDPELDAKPLAEAADAAGRVVLTVIVENADHVLKKEETPKADLGPAIAMNYNAEGRVIAPGVINAIAAYVKVE